jgi:hypothetical protein
MREIRALNVELNSVVGVGETYYLGGPDQNFGVRVSDETLMAQVLMTLRFEGARFTNGKGSGLDYRPIIGPYTIQGFLYEGSLVIVNEMKKAFSSPDARKLAERSFPHTVIDIVSQGAVPQVIEKLRYTAGKLSLPVPNLEVLV